MKDLNKGITGTSELTVTDKDLAVNVGSGSLEVLATPVMIMLMEKAKSFQKVTEYTLIIKNQMKSRKDFKRNCIRYERS